MSEPTPRKPDSEPFPSRERKQAARKRKITRRFKVILAIVLALLAGTFLVLYQGLRRLGGWGAGAPTGEAGGAGTGSTMTPSQEALDEEEHRKGLPVRDFIVE